MFYLVYAYYEIVVVLRVGVVVPVVEPEADCRGAGDVACTVALYLQQGLPEVIGDGKAGGVGACAGTGEVTDSLASAGFAVCGAGNNIHRIRCAANQAARCRFERPPDASVEFLLALRGLVGQIVGLAIHRVVALAVRVGALVATGVRVGIVHRPVAVALYVHLFAVGDVGIVAPAGRCAAALVGAAQRVCNPHGSVVRVVVVVAVVPVGAGGAAAAVELSNIIFASCHCRQFQPTRGGVAGRFGSSK